jgi:hypothetical protein
MKRTIGALWQAASDNKCVYLMTENRRHGLDVRGHIRAAIG